MTASGDVREGAVLPKNVSSQRNKMENNTIYITDTVTNESGLTQPSMQLYHMNMGYPLLDEGVELLIPAKNTLPRDKRAAEGIDEWDYFPPTPGFDEQCIITVSALRTENRRGDLQQGTGRRRQDKLQCRYAQPFHPAENARNKRLCSRSRAGKLPSRGPRQHEKRSVVLRSLLPLNRSHSALQSTL